MTTTVETLLQSDRRGEVLDQISRFLRTPADTELWRVATVRHALIGVLQDRKNRKDESGWLKSWDDAEEKFANWSRIAVKESRTVSRFCFGESENHHSAHVIGVMAALVIHYLEENGRKRTTVLVREAFALNDTLRRIERYLLLKDPAALQIDRSPPPALTLKNALKGLVRPPTISEVQHIFFPSGTSGVFPHDQVYYSSFRYSTVKPKIVYSFLAVKAREDDGIVEFTHIYKSSGPEPIKRRTDGGVIKVGNTIYLIGTSIDTGRGLATETQGLKVMAFGSSTGSFDRRLLTGVFMSTAREWQPVVGRICLLQLGTWSERNEILTDETSEIGVHESGRAFRDHIERLKKRFGIEERLRGRNIGPDLARYISDRINLHPDWDTKKLRMTVRDFEGLQRSVGAEEMIEPRE